jgi:hypothetical protein
VPLAVENSLKRLHKVLESLCGEEAVQDEIKTLKARFLDVDALPDPELGI